MSLGPAVHMALLDFTASYGVSHARKAKITGRRHGTDRKAMLTPPPSSEKGAKIELYSLPIFKIQCKSQRR